MIIDVLVVGGLIAIAIALARLVRGPSSADRVIALDIVLSACVALSVAAALATGRQLFMDVAIGLGLIGFVATIVWARFVDLAEEDRDS